MAITSGTRIAGRMHPLSGLLRCATAGRYKARAGGGCRTTVPYGVNPHALQAHESEPNAPRPLLVSFSGSLDVCCSGARVRCAVGDVLLSSLFADDVEIMPSLHPGTRSIQNASCLARTLAKLEAATNASYAAHARGVWAAHSSPWEGGTSQAVMMSQRAGNALARSVFCLVPAGDTFISSRIYSAIGAGCLPVLLGSHIWDTGVLAFSSRIDYRAFAVAVDDHAYLRSPQGLVPMLRAMPRDEVLRRQRALAAARSHLIFEAAGGAAAAAHFLEDALRSCFPRMAECGARQAAPGANATAQWRHLARHCGSSSSADPSQGSNPLQASRLSPMTSLRPLRLVSSHKPNWDALPACVAQNLNNWSGGCRSLPRS